MKSWPEADVTEISTLSQIAAGFSWRKCSVGHSSSAASSAPRVGVRIRVGVGSGQGQGQGWGWGWG